LMKKNEIEKMDDHILIVEDDTAIRESIHECFERQGYHVSSVASAEEALKILSSKNIHIVITDIMLPGRNGLQLTHEIKQNYDADVIVMTGYSENYSYEEAIHKGASDFVFKPFRFEELLLRLKRVLKERRLTKERNRILNKLENLAITDGLTKLYNLRHFYHLLEIEIDRCSRYGHPLALLLMDIDNFKIYNDSYGHLEGDKVLIRLGQIITSCLRTMDSAFRYGGEEFTIILPETTADEAKNVAHRIKTVVEFEHFLPEPGNPVRITISTGVTEYSNKEPLSTFIKRADQAMYISKEKGRNTISFLFAENA
jgi:two-component system cell cycle response regulator